MVHSLHPFHGLLRLRRPETHFVCDQLVARSIGMDHNPIANFQILQSGGRTAPLEPGLIIELNRYRLLGGGLDVGGCTKMLYRCKT